MCSPLRSRSGGHDLVGVLRLDGDVAVGAVLRAQLDVKQAQEVMDLGHRGHGGLASATAGALLDGDRGRDPEDGVHVGLAGRLHDGAGVGVERFQVAALAFVEEDVEGQGGLAEPDTPVITVNLSRGISTLTFFRLCSRALRISMDMALWRRARISDCSGVPSPAP